MVTPTETMTCTAVQAAAVRAVCRAKGLPVPAGRRIGPCPHVAAALLEASSDVPGSLGDTGRWVDELVAELAPAVAAVLGPAWATATEAAIVGAALSVEESFDRLAAALLVGRSLREAGGDAARSVASRLDADAALLV